MQCNYVKTNKSNAEKMQDIEKCYKFLEELKKAIENIPNKSKQTVFAGNICEDIARIIQREQAIIDLLAENIKLTETQ